MRGNTKKIRDIFIKIRLFVDSLEGSEFDKTVALFRVCRELLDECAWNYSYYEKYKDELKHKNE